MLHGRDCFRGDPIQFQNIKLQLGPAVISKLTASTSIPCAVTEGRTCGRWLHCICSVGECTEGQAEGPVFMWQFQSCSVFSCRSTGIAGMILEKKITFPGKTFTFPGKNIYSPWKRNLGSSGPVVLWSCGPLVLWSSGSGPVVVSCSGPLVLWSPGKDVKRNM